MLQIRNLCVSVEDTAILKNVSLTINNGEIHALMGPNGNGKSTLLQSIMGHPKYTITSGEVFLDGVDLLKLPTNERSIAGLFLGMQHPTEITGITNFDFLNASLKAHGSTESVLSFSKKLQNVISELEMRPDLAHRYLNDGFSGGEKKRNEILQMKLLKPKIAMLDEIDSGLDVDSMRIVAKSVSAMLEESPLGLIVVSHYQRFYEYLKPTHVHVIVNGEIVKTGDIELSRRIDKDGYDWISSQG